MQKLEIKDMKHINGISVNTAMIQKVITDRLNKAGIAFSLTTPTNGALVFRGSDKLTVFSSKFENRIPMAKDDKRAKELGRPFLKSKRLNEEQYKQLFSALKEPFDDLKISCKMVFTSDKVTEVWRDGVTTNLPSINYKLLPKKA